MNPTTSPQNCQPNLAHSPIGYEPEQSSTSYPPNTGLSPPGYRQVQSQSPPMGAVHAMQYHQQVCICNNANFLYVGSEQFLLNFSSLKPESIYHKKLLCMFSLNCFKIIVLFEFSFNLSDAQILLKNYNYLHLGHIVITMFFS